MRLMCLHTGFCLALLVGCNPAAPPSVESEPPVVTLPKEVKELAPAEAAEWLQSHPTALILDLRMPEERVREGKLAGSVGVDWLQSSASQTIERLDRSRPVLVYCALGGRSRLAAVETLPSLGFPEIVVLKGGLEAWQAEGRPVQK